MAEAKKKASSTGRELGRLGAKKGGQARARSLTPAQRSDIARRAVRARWAKAGKVVAPLSVPPDRCGDGVARSLFRGPMSLAGMRFGAHVLADGRRVLERHDVVEAFTGGDQSGALDQALGKLPDYHRDPLALPVVSLRVPGQSTIVTAFEPAIVVALAERLLAARAAGPLKKQPARMADRAEQLVRAAAASGIDGLIDDATGYAKVRARQSAQRTLQAYIAEDLGRWAAHFPKQFWTELARLDGDSPPKRRPVGWGRYVLLFVSDAIDPDVGHELRRDAGDPAFRPTIPQWLDEVGPGRVSAAEWMPSSAGCRTVPISASSSRGSRRSSTKVRPTPNSSSSTGEWFRSLEPAVSSRWARWELVGSVPMTRVGVPVAQATSTGRLSSSTTMTDGWWASSAPSSRST